MSPRGVLRLRSIAWIIIGLGLVILPLLLLPWSNGFWLLIPALVVCLIRSRQLAVRADQTYGWPMSEAMKTALDNRFSGGGS